MGVAKSLHRGPWTCGNERSGLISGSGDEEGIDVWSSTSSLLNCERWLVGVTGSPCCGAGDNLDEGRSVRVA